jgi:hypothetical protein
MAMDGEMSLPMRLLQMVSYGGIRSTAELGKRLGVSEALVTMMAEELRRRGYLQAVSCGSCDTGCASCGIVTQCKLPGPADQLPLLVLTEKGKLRTQVSKSS